MISVILPVYNAEKYLRESILSILNQTYHEFELIIINDGSTDSSRKIILDIKDDRIKFYENDVNLGYLKTINILLGKATGDFIAFEDADDVSHPKRLELQMKYLSQNMQVGIVGTNYELINEKGRHVRQQQMETDPKTLSKLLLTTNPFQKPSLMFRKEVYLQIGGYREAFLQLKNISEDYDWMLRASQSFDFSNINYDEPLYRYRSVKSAMTKGFDNVEQFFGHQIAQYLHRQRLSDGQDDLDRGDIQSLIDRINEMKRPYLEDVSLFYRKKAEMLMYSGLYLSAIEQAFNACKAKPVASNIRLLQHCLRKTLIGI